MGIEKRTSEKNPDGSSLMTCFEETFELAALMLFYAANLQIAEDAGL